MLKRDALAIREIVVNEMNLFVFDFFQVFLIFFFFFWAIFGYLLFGMKREEE